MSKSVDRSDNRNWDYKENSSIDKDVSQMLSEIITRISSVLATVTSIDSISVSNINITADSITAEIIALLSHVTRTSRQYTLTTHKKKQKENELTGTNVRIFISSLLSLL